MARHDSARSFLVNRRGFLAASTSSLLVASRGWCGDEIVVSRPSLGGNPFTLGVASGDPDPHGFVIWTRLAPKPLEGGGMPGDAARSPREYSSLTAVNSSNTAATTHFSSPHLRPSTLACPFQPPICRQEPRRL